MMVTECTGFAESASKRTGRWPNWGCSGSNVHERSRGAVSVTRSSKTSSSLLSTAIAVSYTHTLPTGAAPRVSSTASISASRCRSEIR